MPRKKQEIKEVQFPKAYIHRESNSELCFADTRFHRGEVIIVNEYQEDMLKRTLDYQYGLITLK